MHRLFVGVEPPEAVREQLIGVMEGLSGARWQSEEQLHLTVRFIGEVDGRLAEDAAQALCTLSHAAFSIALSGVGAFERRGRAETLWVGLTPHAPLRSLHEKVDRALALAGIAPEGRAYHPHITIARLNGGSGPIGPFIERHGGLTSAPFPVIEVILYESRLGRAGAHYLPVARVPLRASG